jgi:hypothetical protein
VGPGNMTANAELSRIPGSSGITPSEVARLTGLQLPGGALDEAPADPRLRRQTAYDLVGEGSGWRRRLYLN